MSTSASSAALPPNVRRRLRFADSKQNSEEVAEIVDSKCSANKSVFLSFVDLAPHSSNFCRDDSVLDRALSVCNRLRCRVGFRSGLLLKCVEPNPMFSHLHFATFDSNGNGAEMDGVMFGEIFAIQRNGSFVEPVVPSHRNGGFIVAGFKIMDRNNRFKQRELEKSWLSWTGAREIYKYSPRNWNLRRITLFRIRDDSRDDSQFAYVVLCDFGNILHPANTVGALDMCERLRTRNCGYIGLFQIQYNYGTAATMVGTSTSWSGMSRSPPVSSRSPLSRHQSDDIDDGTLERRRSLLRMRDRSLGFDAEAERRRRGFELAPQ